VLQPQGDGILCRICSHIFEDILTHIAVLGFGVEDGCREEGW